MPKFIIKTVVKTKMKYLVEADSVEEAMKNIHLGCYEGYQKEGKESLLKAKVMDVDISQAEFHEYCINGDYH